MSSSSYPSLLEHISTCWPMIHNPVQFVMRYARAIRAYVTAMVRDPHQAEEVAQDFLLRVLDRGFCPENVSRGRFRDYLKSAVRYVAISHLRRKRPGQLSESELAALEQPQAEHEWTTAWQTCLLDRAWQALELRQQQSPGNLHFTVLRQFTADPAADSKTHAERLSIAVGKRYTPEAFRQQLHRARRQFAQLIVDEVRRTLHAPTDDTLQQELADLGLMRFVREFLPLD